MGQPEDKPGFIEEALRHREVDLPDSEPGVDEVDEADLVTDDVMAEPESVIAEAEPALAVEPEPAREPEPEPAREPEPEPMTIPFEDWPLPDRALIDEALKKSGLLWLQTKAVPGGQGYWHVWLNDTIYLLTGGPEQPDGGLETGEVVKVVVRSKETTARLISFEGAVTDLLPTDTDWTEAATALAAARLNLDDAAGAPDRWARDPDRRLVRVTPSAPDGERPGAYSSDSHRAAPRPSTATTAGSKPLVLHRRHGSGRPLS